MSTLYRLEPSPPSVNIEVVYATSQNFMGTVLYDAPHLLLVKEAALALRSVLKLLRKEGYGLLLWDGYRPLSVQKQMWEKLPDERFVSDPAKGGRHTRGTAIDLTLTDLEGRALEMPTLFDDFTEKAGYGYVDLSPDVLKRRDLLRSVMEAAHFEPIPTEWWHFDLKGWEKFPPLDVPLTSLRSSEAFQL